jgi:hypothetical protein
MKHVVMFSGGVGSWAAAKRVVEKHGTDDVVLLFADTLIEDADLYRSLNDYSANLGLPITRIQDGRTPWQVFRDVKFLGNSRVDPCSRILKRELMNKWRDDNCDPANSVMYLGIDWSEIHRIDTVRERNPGWTYEAPMCERPLLTKAGMLHWQEREGIKVQKLYDMGFPHANCGGFCVKAGHAQFRLLLEKMPARYAEHEANENAIREELGDVAIMRDRAGGESRPLTMTEFRQRYEGGERTEEMLLDFGGCGCALE